LDTSQCASQSPTVNTPPVVSPGCGPRSRDSPAYGGGFVIIPLIQHDAVHTYHWMTDTQFLDAVALGQITPGPVVQTVALVGYAAARLGGGLRVTRARAR
jgi:hypothetical protein